jgi:iron complex transport system ATP-binding protein
MSQGPIHSSQPLFELSDAEVVRDGRAILNVDHLTIAEGERIAVLGPNGSGKSTLIGLLTRDVLPLARPDTQVRFRGNARRPLFEVRASLGVVSGSLQDLHRRALTVAEVVASGFFGSIGLHLTQHPTSAMLTRAHDAMRDLGISALADRRMDTLSTGEARRALIARALVHDPSALVLDEPCDGLDPSATYHVLDAIRRLARTGRGIVLVTHHVDDIVPEIDRVVLLKGGRVIADGPKSHVLTSENLARAYDVPLRLDESGGWYRLWYEPEG